MGAATNLRRTGYLHMKVQVTSAVIVRRLAAARGEGKSGKSGGGLTVVSVVDRGSSC